MANAGNDLGEPVGGRCARRRGLDASAAIPAAPDAGELGNWAQEAYSLSVSAAASLGFPVGNITATFQRDALMFGTSRWTDKPAPPARRP